MTKIVLNLIKFYQITISPDHGPIFAGSYMRCRFYPSCSQYTYEAIEGLGVGKGLLKGLKRILRCNPFSKGGVDPIVDFPDVAQPQILKKLENSLRG